MNKLREDIIKISKDLMIDFSLDDIQKIEIDLKESINLLNRIHEIDLSKIIPTNFLNIATSNHFREDVVEDFANKKELLENVDEIINGYIKV